MKFIDKQIKIVELKQMSGRMFGGLVKAVVDLKREVMVVDAAMHADEEQMLLESGSSQEDLWGINFYPELSGDDFIEFDSMINIRPRQNNLSRSVENEEIRQKIKQVISKLITQ